MLGLSESQFRGNSIALCLVCLLLEIKVESCSTKKFSADPAVIGTLPEKGKDQEGESHVLCSTSCAFD